MRKLVQISLFLFMLALLVAPVSAQTAATPSVSVSDQQSLDGTVRVNSAYSEGPGFVVIHKDDGTGNPGPVLGFKSVQPGWNYRLDIPIDATQATPRMFAMLHVDDGTIGAYEFDGQSGLDNPVSVNGQVVTPGFNVNLIRAFDQFVQNDTVTIAAVISQTPGWLVIHAGDAQNFGAVLGQTQVQPGLNANVVVNITQDGRTQVLWPMLHVDTGTAGQYEFGVVEGADSPVVTAGKIATLAIWTVPHVRVYPQAALPGDGQQPGPGAYTLVAESVLSEGQGFLVAHNETNGTFGPVAGFAPVSAGFNPNVTITLDPAVTTPRLWPMLHVDDTTVGQYEFGTVEGADAPVLVNGEILTFPVNVAPSLVMRDQVPLPGEAAGTTRFTLDEVLIDAPGWVAIHQDAGGQAGPVIGTVFVNAGRTRNITVEVPAAEAGVNVFPMLHYDTGTLGVYEFDGQNGLDSPVSVLGNVVFGPLRLLTAAEATAAAQQQPAAATAVAPAQPPAQPPAATPDVAAPVATQEVAAPAAGGICTVNAGGNNVNLRGGPSTDFPAVGTLAAGTSAVVVGQTSSVAGVVWWQLDNGSFVRSDVVTVTGDCANVPVIDTSGLVPPPTAVAPAQPPAQPPATTPEVGG